MLTRLACLQGYPPPIDYANGYGVPPGTQVPMTQPGAYQMPPGMPAPGYDPAIAAAIASQVQNAAAAPRPVQQSPAPAPPTVTAAHPRQAPRRGAAEPLYILRDEDDEGSESDDNDDTDADDLGGRKRK
jgi:hypothetical protein